MEEIKARLKLTQVLVQALKQGLTIDDIRKLLKLRMDSRTAGK
ncbi:hypothetical protein [Desulfobacter sp.]|nr:hypothetical protein [Desulfobacter sp.]